MFQGETEGKIQGFDTDIEGETIKEANPDVQKAMRLFWSLDDCMAQRENKKNKMKSKAQVSLTEHNTSQESREARTGRTFYTE